jgi:hypothetical protein
LVNYPEQPLRHTVIFRKLIFGNRSDDGTHTPSATNKPKSALDGLRSSQMFPANAESTSRPSPQAKSESGIRKNFDDRASRSHAPKRDESIERQCVEICPNRLHSFKPEFARGSHGDI